MCHFKLLLTRVVDAGLVGYARFLLQHVQAVKDMRQMEAKVETQNFTHMNFIKSVTKKVLFIATLQNVCIVVSREYEPLV